MEHARKREAILGVGERVVEVVAHDEGRTQKRLAVHFDEARTVAVFRGKIDRTGRGEKFVETLVDGLRGFRIGETAEDGVGVIPRKRFDRGKFAGERVGERVAVVADQDGGAVDATAAAICGDRVDDDVEVFRPVCGEIVANDNFATTRTVDVDVAVGRVFFQRGVATERNGAAGAEEKGVAAVVCGRIKTEGFTGEAGGDHRLDEAEGGEGIFAAGLQHDGDFHHECGQPEGIDAGGIAREEHAEAVGLGEEIYVEAVLANEAAVEELEGHAAREAGDHGADVGHRGVDFAHVGAREAVRETGELREGDRVVVGALEAVVVAPRELAVEEELGGFFHVADERFARDRA